VLKPIDRNSQWLGWLEGCKRRGTHLVALVLPAIKEVEAPEGDGGSEQGHSSVPSSGAEYLSHSGSDNLSHTGGGGYDPGQSSQSSGESDSGEADGDEAHGFMQNLMEEEDLDGLTNDLDSDEEEVEENNEEVQIPGSWNQDLANGMTVNDGHESAWEYHQNKVKIGVVYATRQHLRDAVIQSSHVRNT